jgi:hypothetical protein
MMSIIFLVMCRQWVPTDTEMTPRQIERMDQETMRQLNRSLAKKASSAELPRLIGTKQVCLKRHSPALEGMARYLHLG